MPDDPKPQLDRLTSQLYYLPSIIARLGLGIAEAQKELNADYLLALARVLELTRGGTTPPAPLGADMLPIVQSLLPARYQFTETTIDFAADLSERKSVGTDVGVGGGVGAFMVTAAFSLSYGYDYRAAARVTSVVHAHGFDANVGKVLLDRAAAATGTPPTLPAKTAVDEDISKRLGAVRDMLKQT